MTPMINRMGMHNRLDKLIEGSYFYPDYFSDEQLDEVSRAAKEFGLYKQARIPILVKAIRHKEGQLIVTERYQADILFHGQVFRGPVQTPYGELTVWNKGNFVTVTIGSHVYDYPIHQFLSPEFDLGADLMEKEK